jgi:hypothetical protein
MTNYCYPPLDPVVGEALQIAMNFLECTGQAHPFPETGRI